MIIQLKFAVQQNASRKGSDKEQDQAYSVSEITTTVMVSCGLFAKFSLPKSYTQKQPEQKSIQEAFIPLCLLKTEKIHDFNTSSQTVNLIKEEPP